MKKITLFLINVIFSISVYAGVNVNTASVEALASALKGIGLKKGQAIIDYCHNNACNKPEDLLNVKGIGRKTLEKIKQDLIFDNNNGKPVEKAQQQ